MRAIARRTRHPRLEQRIQRQSQCLGPCFFCIFAFAGCWVDQLSELHSHSHTWRTKLTLQRQGSGRDTEIGPLAIEMLASDPVPQWATTPTTAVSMSSGLHLPDWRPSPYPARLTVLAKSLSPWRCPRAFWLQHPRTSTATSMPHLLQHQG